MEALFSGAFVPLTMEGNIMVDGVLASCYASADHDISHFLLTPMRWFPEMMEWIFGDDYGFSVYYKTWAEIGAMIVPYGQINL